jgi:hypothetical protein
VYGRGERGKQFLNVIKCQALEEVHVVASQNHLSRGTIMVPLFGKSCLLAVL